MPELSMLKDFLGGADVDGAVLSLRPGYRAMLVAVDGHSCAMTPLQRCSSSGALDPVTDEMLSAAAEDLIAHLTRPGPDVRAVQRLIGDRQPHRDHP